MSGTDLKVKLYYAQDEGPGKAPYYYTAPLTQAQKEATGRKEQSAGKTVEIEVTVRDGRNHQHSLDKHSFELAEQVTACIDNGGLLQGSGQGENCLLS